MKPLFPALAAAFVAVSMSGPALAQTTDPMPMPSQGASEHAPGTMKRKEGERSASEFAPGQAQNSGEVDSARDAAPGQIDRQTTASIDLSAEQETQVRPLFTATPFEGEVDATVGAVIPGTVTLETVPAEVVTIVPDYADHEYFVTADGSIVIVEPTSLEVVYVIEAEV